MVDTLHYPKALPEIKYISGVVGLDGYLKNGDSWNELTNWAMGGYKGMDPQVTGGSFVYVDYCAPSYFNIFSKVLTTEGKSPWLISQYKRAEASSDWAMGQMAAQNLVGFAGNWRLDAANNATFSSFSDGEDFRVGWRTVLNYVWHGNPTTTWNPNTHEVEAGGNTYELNFAKNNEKFLLSPQAFGQKPYTLPVYEKTTA